MISDPHICGKTKGVYRWQVAGRHLTFVKVHDSCEEEAGIFPGLWTRE
jgi:hypothetical protein